MAKSVTVRIIQGRALLPSDPNGLSDPYCRVFTEHTSKHRKDYTTHTVHKSLNPQWGESFALPIVSETDNLIFEVMDKDIVFDDHIGKAFCSLKNLVDGVETVFWLPLNPQGDIEVGLTPKGFSTFKPPKENSKEFVTVTTTKITPGQPNVVVTTTSANPVVVPLPGVPVTTSTVTPITPSPSQEPASTSAPVLVRLEGAPAPVYTTPATTSPTYTSPSAYPSKAKVTVNYTSHTTTTTTSNYTYRRPVTPTTYHCYKPPRSTYHSTYHPTHHSTFHSGGGGGFRSGGGGGMHTASHATGHAFRG